MDNTPSHLITGQEDGVVKVYDFRRTSGAKSVAALTFDSCHERWISQVRVNPQAENVFLTAGYDGKVKMWDMRNSTEPLSVLKRTTQVPDDKVFATAWNGPSQILSGGADSHVSVHEMGSA
jgi:WD40 repeat protein